MWTHPLPPPPSPSLNVDLPATPSLNVDPPAPPYLNVDPPAPPPPPPLAWRDIVSFLSCQKTDFEGIYINMHVF